MERCTLLWINDTQLVEASATHLRCYNREGQLLAYRREEDSAPVVLPLEALAEGGARQGFQIN